MITSWRAIVLSLPLAAGLTVLDGDAWPAGSGNIVLTFDDGPNRDPTVSRRLLDVLHDKGVVATFCYIGANVDRHPEVVARARAEGHDIAVHGYEHTWTSLLSDERFHAEYVRSVAALRRAVDEPDWRPLLIRPPLGVLSPGVRAVIEEQGLYVAYLTFFVNDAWTGPEGAADVLSELRAKTSDHRGGAIVFHEMRYKADGGGEIDKSWLPGAVGEFIDWARAEGFTFVTYSSRESGAE